MPFRFYRRIRILPALRVNLSRSGISASIGRRGAWLTLRAGRTPRATVGLPGTGLSYTEGGHVARPGASGEDRRAQGSAFGAVVRVAILIAVGAIVWRALH